MRSLKESLFDKDIIKSNEPGALSIINSIIDKIGKNKISFEEWTNVLDDLMKSISYEHTSFARVPLSYEKAKRIKPGKLYIYIDEFKYRIYLVGVGLSDINPDFPSLIEIAYDSYPGHSHIFVEVKYQDTGDYAFTFGNSKRFQIFKMTNKEIDEFNKLIRIDKIDIVL